MTQNSLVRKYETNSAWKVVAIPGSGVYIKAQGGPILARLSEDPPALAFWDKKHGCEVSISVATLGDMFDSS